MKVREGLLRFLPPAASAEDRLAVAEGRDEGFNGLGPADRATVLFVLSHDRDAGVAGAAKKAFSGLGAGDAAAALEAPLEPRVIRAVVREWRDNEAVQVLAATNDFTDPATRRWLAEHGTEAVAAVISEDLAALRSDPALVDALAANPVVKRAVVEGLREELAGPGNGAGGKAGAEEEDEEELSLYQRLQRMAMGDKVKLAFTGNKEARELLIKDPNKMINMAVLKNPRITEEEVSRLANSKSVADDVLRAITRNKEWMKNYSTKLGIVSNPKTPVNITIKLIGTLYDKDVEKLAKSRNIPNTLANAARRILDAKKKR